MKYYLTVLFILNFLNLYSQDNYLKRVGLEKKDIQLFCDSAKEENKFRTISFSAYKKDIELSNGEFFYVNNDTSFIYEKPSYWDSKKIDELVFSDSVYVIKDNEKSDICIFVSGADIGGERYILCSTKTGKLGWLKCDDFIPPSKMILSQSEDYYLTSNRTYKLLISKDKKKHFKIPTENLIWLEGKEMFLFNDCNVNCNSNSIIYKFDLRKWKSEKVCRGVFPYDFNLNNIIFYYKDSVVNSSKKEFLYSLNIQQNKSELFYQIPDSLTYWLRGDDYITPSSIQEVQIENENLYKITFYKKGSDNVYIDNFNFYFNKEKQLIKITKR